MNKAYTLKQEKLYLDQMPLLHKVLENFCTELQLDEYGSGAENWVSELECRRQDGFIPHSHNCGGFDVYNTYDSEPGEEEDEDSTIIFHGFRIMYEGINVDTHTVCIYYCRWDEHDCYGMNKAPTIDQLEIVFTKSNELFKQLTDFTNKYTK